MGRAVSGDFRACPAVRQPDSVSGTLRPVSLGRGEGVHGRSAPIWAKCPSPSSPAFWAREDHADQPPDPPRGGRRLAVVVNEFGTLGVDGDILKSCAIPDCPAENIVELANGCICCTVADDFIPRSSACSRSIPGPITS
jgi:hypothetical protein